MSIPHYEPKDSTASKWTRAVSRWIAGRPNRSLITYRHVGDLLPTQVGSGLGRVRGVRVLRVSRVGFAGTSASGNRVEWGNERGRLEVSALDDVTASVAYDVTLEVVSDA